MRRWLSLTPFDGLLLLMVLIWGANFTVVKAALGDIPPQAFNALRLFLAAGIFLIAILVQGVPPLHRRDWMHLAVLGIVGHFIYQSCFMGGLARTTASNSSLILGCSPVAVSLASALAGHERIPRGQWMGVLLSVAGIYLVVGTGAHFNQSSLSGDSLTLLAVACWAIYTVGSRDLLARYSPLVVTGLTMAFGTAAYVPVSLPSVLQLEWGRVHLWAWTALVFSSILALNVGYLIWYTSVQRMGNIRTSVYSNITPIVGMTVAAAFLDERLTRMRLAGAAAILCGVAITRIASGRKSESDPPAEE